MSDSGSWEPLVLRTHTFFLATDIRNFMKVLRKRYVLICQMLFFFKRVTINIALDGIPRVMYTVTLYRNTAQSLRLVEYNPSKHETTGYEGLHMHNCLFFF